MALSKAAKKVINSTKSKSFRGVSNSRTPLGQVGYDNPRDDIERVKKLREGSVEKVPVNANDIVNKAYADSHSPIAHATTHRGVSSDPVNHDTLQNFAANEHFTEASIDHANILNIGTKGHVAIDTHIADNTLHFIEASIDHTAIQNIGTNAHSVIDTHLGSSSNPHTVTLQQATDAGSTTDNEIEITSTGSVTPSLKFTNDAATCEIFMQENDGLEFDSFTNFTFKTTQATAGTHTIPFYNNDLADRKRDIIFHVYGRGTNAGAKIQLKHGGDAGDASITTSIGKILIETADPTGGIEFIPVNRGSTTLNIHGSEQVAVGNVAPTNLFSVKEKSSMSPIGGFCIMLTNKTGSNSVSGDLVSAHTTINDAVEQTAASGTTAIGVFLSSGVSDGSEAWVVIAGIADVHMDAAGASNGDRIVASSATAGRGRSNNAPSAAVHWMEIGHCVETTAGNGTGRCVLHFN